MTPKEACQLIVDLFEWDEDGVVGPKPPYSWMTVASIAGDYSKGALADSETCICDSGALQPEDTCQLHGHL
jgi:hypothetical protein